jgi:hypothetical protein
MPDGHVRDTRDERMREAIELVATVLLAMATVLTAWSAFQSTKWSGTQAIHFARAGALRTESAKASARANAQEIVDVDTFMNWVNAVAEERRADPNSASFANGTYTPAPGTLSAFLFERFRDEFKPAVQAWIDQDPLDNPDAAPTPFSLSEYRLAEQTRSDHLSKAADHETELARRDNQRGDNYVLLTVLFASVLFFAGVSGKLGSTRNRAVTVGFAVVLLVSGIALLATFPTNI